MESKEYSIINEEGIEEKFTIIGKYTQGKKYKLGDVGKFVCIGDKLVHENKVEDISMVDEIIKCKASLKYFYDTYFKIVHKRNKELKELDKETLKANGYEV